MQRIDVCVYQVQKKFDARNLINSVQGSLILHLTGGYLTADLKNTMVRN